MDAELLGEFFGKGLEVLTVVFEEEEFGLGGDVGGGIGRSGLEGEGWGRTGFSGLGDGLGQACEEFLDDGFFVWDSGGELVAGGVGGGPEVAFGVIVLGQHGDTELVEGFEFGREEG